MKFLDAILVFHKHIQFHVRIRIQLQQQNNILMRFRALADVSVKLRWRRLTIAQ